MLFSSFPVSFNSLSFAVATSCNSDPYLNVLPESECTTDVDSESCFWMASNKAERWMEAIAGEKEAKGRP